MTAPTPRSAAEVERELLRSLSIAVHALCLAAGNDSDAAVIRQLYEQLDAAKRREATDAQSAALDDARHLGIGFLMIRPDGRAEHLSPEAVSIDRERLLAERREARDGG